MLTYCASSVFSLWHSAPILATDLRGLRAVPIGRNRDSLTFNLEPVRPYTLVCSVAGFSGRLVWGWLMLSSAEP